MVSTEHAHTGADTSYDVLQRDTAILAATLGELAAGGEETARNLLPDLERQLDAWREIRTRLRALQQTVDEHLVRAERLHAAARAVALAVPTDGEGLRGKRIAPVAVKVWRERGNPDGQLHYRDLLRLIQDAGYRVGGKDPEATLLTALSRSPAIESVGARSGLYRLAEEEQRG